MPLESFLNVDGELMGTEQASSHPATGTKVPIELQNKSMMVRGWIRMIGATVSPLMKL